MKKYVFTRNGKSICERTSCEVVTKIAHDTQSWEHTQKEDVENGKAVLYKVEEFEKNNRGAWKRTATLPIILDQIQNPAVPARLDADGKAKPLTSIVTHMHPDHCYHGVKPFHDPALRNNETGDKTPLYRSN